MNNLPERKISMHPNLQILFQDETILAVNKPAGILVIPDRWDKTKPNLIALLSNLYPDCRFYIVHRLDEGTSGVVLFARTADAHRILNQQLQDRRVEKIYLAIVTGEFEADQGSIDLPIGSDSQKKNRMTIQRTGKESITEYEVLQRFRGFTYLKVKPKTGRTHQIRVHLKAIGHPLAVDPIYGKESAIYLSQMKPNYKQKPDEPERPLIQRLTLHAAEIQFTHPTTGERMTASAEFSKDFRAFLHALEKYRGKPGKKSNWHDPAA